MRRMVGAAILVVGVGSITVLRWPSEPPHPPAVVFSQRIIDSAADVMGAVSPPDSVRAPRPVPITRLSDPLAFLSTAGADSLDLLPGVGPVLAARLIAAREAHGAFRSWDDVDRVRGIGPKTVERLRALASH